MDNPITDVKLVGVIKVRNYYMVPVYEIPQITTLDEATAFANRGTGARIRYLFGNGLEDIIPFLDGTPLLDMREAANLAESAASLPSSSVFVTTETEFRATGFVGKRVTSQRNNNNSLFGSVYYYIDAQSSPIVEYPTLTCSVTIYPKSMQNSKISYKASGNGPGVFIRINDSGEYKFIRVIIDCIQEFNTELSYSIEFSSNPFGPSGDIFFGFSSSRVVTIDEIANGEFIDTPIINNPFEPMEPSYPGNLPPGTFDDTSDPIPDSPLPTLSAANTGFTRIYNPTLSQVQDLANYLWTDESVINTIWNHVKQFFEDPMQAIIGFNLVPCLVPDAGSKEFALMFIKTGVTMNVAANQFVDVECGSVELKRYYGSALDQSPYTKVSCFLPFIGVVSLNTDEVMGTTLSVRYRIDIVSGSCVAKILVDNNVLYQYSGHCAINIPISSSDFSSYVSAAISVAKLSIGYGLAGAFDDLGLTQDPVSQTSTTSTLTTTESNTVRNPSTGRQITSGTRTTTQVLEEQKDTTTTKASYDGLTPANVANTVGQIMGSKPHVEHSGSFNGNTGYLGVRRPYLIIERPNMCLPENYQSLNGFPSMITMPLGNCKGYTRVQQVQLTGMQGASINEQSEIQSFLKSGVIF